MSHIGALELEKRIPQSPTAHDELSRMRDLGDRVSRVARVIARMIGGDALDHDPAGERVHAGDRQARGRLLLLAPYHLQPVPAAAVSLALTRARATGHRRRYDLAVLRPGDREGRVALLDHAGHVGAHALREVLVERERGYLGRHCRAMRTDNDTTLREAGETRISNPLNFHGYAVCCLRCRRSSLGCLVVLLQLLLLVRFSVNDIEPTYASKNVLAIYAVVSTCVFFQSTV